VGGNLDDADVLLNFSRISGVHCDSFEGEGEPEVSICTDLSELAGISQRSTTSVTIWAPHSKIGSAMEYEDGCRYNGRRVSSIIRFG
jgi:hypothetical protein